MDESLKDQANQVQDVLDELVYLPNKDLKTRAADMKKKSGVGYGSINDMTNLTKSLREYESKNKQLMNNDLRKNKEREKFKEIRFA